MAPLSKGQIALIILIVASVLATCALIIWVVTKKDDSPAEAAPNPLVILLESGQQLQSRILDITTSPPPAFAIKPTGLTASSAAAAFTLSLDIKCATVPTDLTQVIGMGPHPGFPGMWFHPSYPGKLMVHLSDKTIALPVANVPPANTYFKITLVFDPSAGTTMYFNNTIAATDTSLKSLTWPADVTNWRWNQQAKTSPKIEIKNAYWWNKPLTESEVSTLVQAVFIDQ